MINSDIKLAMYGLNISLYLVRSASDSQPKQTLETSDLLYTFRKVGRLQMSIRQKGVDRKQQCDMRNHMFYHCLFE